MSLNKWTDFQSKLSCFVADDRVLKCCNQAPNQLRAELYLKSSSRSVHYNLHFVALCEYVDVNSGLYGHYIYRFANAVNDTASYFGTRSNDNRHTDRMSSGPTFCSRIYKVSYFCYKTDKTCFLLHSVDFIRLIRYLQNYHLSISKGVMLYLLPKYFNLD